MKVKLVKRQEITKDFVIFEFKTLNQIINFIPGQFFQLTLINPIYVDDRGNSRYFGFTNLPDTNIVQMLTKKGTSAFKKTLMEMPLDEEVEIDRINGRIDLPNDKNIPIVFIALDIGIAPIISIIRSVIKNNLSYKISLIYISKDNLDAPFLTEFREYSNQNKSFKLILSEALDEQIIKTGVSEINNCNFIVKGEQNSVLQAVKLLKNLTVEANKISMEIFTGY